MPALLLLPEQPPDVSKHDYSPAFAMSRQTAWAVFVSRFLSLAARTAFIASFRSASAPSRSVSSAPATVTVPVALSVASGILIFGILTGGWPVPLRRRLF